MDETFANFYMTLLASRLAERVGARLLTSLAPADRLAVTARLDSRIPGILPDKLRLWREYEAFGPRRHMPRQLAAGMLAELAIERIGVDPDTPLDRLIKFRDEYRDELAQFRTQIDNLASSVEADLPAEALRQRVTEIYCDQVKPATSNLKAALEGRRIRWLGEGIQKIAFLSVGSSTMLVAAGLAIPTALLAGAGVSLVATGAMYNADRRDSLRANPFSYLLAVERELA